MGPITRIALIAGLTASAGYGTYDQFIAKDSADKADAAQAGPSPAASAISQMPVTSRPDSRHEVLARFGMPNQAERHNAMWSYDGFNVLFSGDRVVGWVETPADVRATSAADSKTARKPRKASFARVTPSSRHGSVVRGSAASRSTGGRIYSPGKTSSFSQFKRDRLVDRGSSNRFQFYRPQHQFNRRDRQFVNTQRLAVMFDHSSSLTRGRRGR